MVDEEAKTSKMPASTRTSATPDGSATAVCALVMILSMARVPERLSLSPEAVTAIGSTVLAVAALIRAFIDHRSGRGASLNEAAAVLVAMVAGIFTATGHTVMSDPNDVAMLGSGLGIVMSGARAWLTSNFPEWGAGSRTTPSDAE